MGTTQETGDSVGMGVEQSFLRLRNAISAPIDLDEFGKFTLLHSDQQLEVMVLELSHIWVYHLHKRVLDPEILKVSLVIEPGVNARRTSRQKIRLRAPLGRRFLMLVP